MTNDFSLPGAFWSGFVADHWEERPLLLKQPFPVPLASLEEIFQGLVTASERHRAGDRNSQTRFFLENSMLRADIGKYLPGPEDRSAEAYAERTERSLKGSFGIYVEHFHIHAPPIWDRTREFLRGLYGLVGLPAHHATAELFFGTYPRTPIGIHVDHAATFMFVLAGRRRMRVWPPEAFPDQQVVNQTLDYQSYLDRSICLEGEAGDVFYWPSTYWHIGESEGGLWACLDVSLFMRSQAWEEVLQTHLSRSVRRQLGASAGPPMYAFDPLNPQACTQQIPSAWEQGLHSFREAIRGNGLDLVLKEAWLNRLSGSGFSPVPAPLVSVHLPTDAVVRGNPHAPILWSPIGNGDLLCSANGQSFLIPADPAIIKLLERLNRGEPVTLEILKTEFQGRLGDAGNHLEIAPEEIQMLVEKLVSLRALACDGPEPLDLR